MHAGPLVLLVEDHPLYREGLARVLAARVPGVRCRGAAGVAEARRLAQAEPDLDLVVADWHLPDGDGLALLAHLARQRPTVGRVLLSGDEDPRLADRARRLGLMGFIPKRLAPEAVGAALAAVLQGEPWFPSPAIAVAALRVRERTDADRRSVDAGPAHAVDPGDVPSGAAAVALTPRQRRVLSQAAAGAGNKEIARSLGLSERTVKFHLAGAFERLHASSRTEAVASALALGLIRPPRT